MKNVGDKLGMATLEEKYAVIKAIHEGEEVQYRVRNCDCSVTCNSCMWRLSTVSAVNFTKYEYRVLVHHWYDTDIEKVKREGHEPGSHLSIKYRPDVNNTLWFNLDDVNELVRIFEAAAEGEENNED